MSEVTIPLQMDENHGSLSTNSWRIVSGSSLPPTAAFLIANQKMVVESIGTNKNRFVLDQISV